jgi:hypothetical protein
MVLLPAHPPVRTPLLVKGVLFGARGGSCSCDPCDCNPCRCGDSVAPDLPLWRVSGIFIEAGSRGALDLSHRLLLSLALPDKEGHWEEFLCVEQNVSPEHAEGLLTLFEEYLTSLPAELEPQLRSRRAVYRAPLAYMPDATRPLLRARVTREQITQIRPGALQAQAFPCEWVYDGPMAVRGTIARHA